MKFGQLSVTVDGRTRDYPIDLPSLIVGRADGSSIVIDDLSVARRHARLIVDSGRLLIEDLGSSSGTFIDGQRIPVNTPSLAEDEQEIRFGDVLARYQAPEGSVESQPSAGHSIQPAPEEQASAELPPNIRATLSIPPQAIEAGGAPAIGRLTVQNRGRVVDELSVEVDNIPAEWVRLSHAKVILLPGEQTEVTIIIQPPRHFEAQAGDYDFSVTVTSGETGREVLCNGQVHILPFEATTLTLHPVRSKKRFSMVAENNGNARAIYQLSATDDEEAFWYAFEFPTVELDPGQQKTVNFRVTQKKRKWFGPTIASPFSVVATPTNSDSTQKTTAVGQLSVRPTLQPFVRPAALLVLAALIAVGIYWYFFWPSSTTVTAANAEAAYAGVHMCDKSANDRPPVPTGAAADSTAPLFAQVDPRWANDEYAKAKDPEFGPDWCGTTIEQCGCAMTSVATVMALFQDVTMPDGTELNPQALNTWFNLQARKTAKGWVSQGYVYGDVVWTAANQLSGEIAKVKPDAHKVKFSRIGTGSDEEVITELKAGRPVILEVPGHWIAAIGLDSSGKILINDPYYRDRKTLDVYAGKVKSSVLFEQTDDLSAVVVTAPSNVRVRITDKEGRVAGTLNTGTPEEAAKEALTGIPGSSYSYRAAWRDPTCVESPPPPGAGTNQIILPGSKDDYKIEAVDAAGGPTSVAIHTYDHNGVVSVQTQDNPGPAVLAVSYDPAQASTQVSVVPGAVPTPEAQPSPATGGGVPVSTPKPSVTTTPTKAATGVPGTSTPTATPTPAAPNNVTLACTVAYVASPKTATVNCTATVDGTFTSTKWSVNGVPVPSGTGKTLFSTTFQDDANADVSVTACNATACRTGDNSVKVQFPATTPTAAPTATPTLSVTPTPTPAVPISSPNISCAATGTQFSQTFNCSVSFVGDYNSIAWSAPGTTPPDASSGTKNFSVSASVGSPGDPISLGSVTSGSWNPNGSLSAVQAVLDSAGWGAGAVIVSGSSTPTHFVFQFVVGATICNGSECTPTATFVQLTVTPGPTPTPVPTMPP